MPSQYSYYIQSASKAASITARSQNGHKLKGLVQNQAQEWFNFEMF